MMSSPLARRQSASGSPEHVLVPIADCPEDISHIIQSNQWLRLTRGPEQRQLEIEYRGDVPQMKLSCHSEQMGDKTKHTLHRDTTFHMQTFSPSGTYQNSSRLFNTYWFSLMATVWPVAIKLVSLLRAGYIRQQISFVAVIPLMGANVFSFKCQFLAGQCNCVSENTTAGVTNFNLSWTFCGILSRCALWYWWKKKTFYELLFESLDPTSACNPAIGFKTGTDTAVITVILVLL